MQRIRVSLAGSVVGGGVATHFGALDDSTIFQPAVKSFWQSLASVMAGQTTITVPNSVDIINPTTGELEDAVSYGTVGTYIGGGSGAYAAGIGASITWTTTNIVYGHRVSGRTFVVPMALNSWFTDGTLTDAARGTLLTAATAFQTAALGELVIWTRNKPAPGGVGPDRPGAISAVTGNRVADRTGWLASRKK